LYCLRTGHTDSQVPPEEDTRNWCKPHPFKGAAAPIFVGKRGGPPLFTSVANTYNFPTSIREFFIHQVKPLRARKNSLFYHHTCPKGWKTAVNPLFSCDDRLSTNPGESGTIR
jgi:hypothetical protein